MKEVAREFDITINVLSGFKRVVEKNHWLHASTYGFFGVNEHAIQKEWKQLGMYVTC